MATKNKTKEINIVEEGGAFQAFFKRFSSDTKGYDFEGISALRRLLSNERARLLHTIKTKSPKSIYELAKLLSRDFKSVEQDIKLLERFGFIDLISEKSGNRNRLRPVIVIDTLHITIKV